MSKVGIINTVANDGATTIINDLTTGGTNKALSAQQGVALKSFIDAINNILASDEVSLDELQEIVDYIKANRADLDALGISSIIGLQSALDTKANAIELSKLMLSSGIQLQATTADLGLTYSTNTPSYNFNAVAPRFFSVFFTVLPQSSSFTINLEGIVTASVVNQLGQAIDVTDLAVNQRYFCLYNSTDGKIYLSVPSYYRRYTRTNWGFQTYSPQRPTLYRAKQLPNGNWAGILLNVFYIYNPSYTELLQQVTLPVNAGDWTYDTVNGRYLFASASPGQRVDITTDLINFTNNLTLFGYPVALATQNGTSVVVSSGSNSGTHQLIKKSTDGGVTWTNVSQTITNDVIYSTTISKFITAGNTQYARSVDNVATSFVFYSTPHVMRRIIDIGGEILAICDNNVLGRSIDGITWAYDTVNGHPATFTLTRIDIIYDSIRDVLLLGDGVKTYISYDRARTWGVLDETIGANALSVINQVWHRATRLSTVTSLNYQFFGGKEKGELLLKGVQKGTNNVTIDSTNPDRPKINVDGYTKAETDLQISAYADALHATLNKLTTKGDILIYDGISYQRLPVGVNDQQLVADNLTSLGLKWQTPKKTFTLFYNTPSVGSSGPLAALRVGTNQSWNNLGMNTGNVVVFTAPFDCTLIRASLTCSQVSMAVLPGETNQVNVNFQLRNIGISDGGTTIGPEITIPLGNNIGNVTGFQDLTTQGFNRHTELAIPINKGDRLTLSFQGKNDSSNVNGINGTYLTLLILEN